jgi:hypothetical protein
MITSKFNKSRLLGMGYQSQTLAKMVQDQDSGTPNNEIKF